MAIQISGTTVINDQKELATGLQSVYERTFVATASTTLQNRDYCVANVAGIAVTLPASPSAGNEVVIVVGGNFTNTTVGRNSQYIMGVAEDMTIDKAYAAMNFVYSGITTVGWRVF
jgi:hypothetical protein